MYGTSAIPSTRVSPLYFLQSVKRSAHWREIGGWYVGAATVRENSMADMPANNQAAVQTEQRERGAQQLAKLGASPAALLLTSAPGPQGRN